MKFGKELEQYANSEWAEFYVPYKKLKRLLKRIKFAEDKYAREEENQKRLRDIANGETQPLVPAPIDRGELDASIAEFWQQIDETLSLVNQFYFQRMQQLSERVSKLEFAFTDAITPRGHVHKRPRAISTDFDRGFAGVQNLYDALVDMREYSRLNFQGFRKIVKKYDKTLKVKESDAFLEKLENSHFRKATDLEELTETLCQIVSRDRLENGNIQRKMQMAIKSDTVFQKVKIWPFMFSWVLFLLVMLVPLFPEDRAVEHRCLGLLTLVITLWISEAIPYFATALCIPPLVVFMRVMTDPNDRARQLDIGVVGKQLLSELFDHTSIVILGGYAISAAFAKCQIELYLAAYLQRVFGNRPKLFLLAFMFMGLFLSMWISNHTAPVLCVSVLLPIIRDFPRDSPFVKTVLIGLAFACNLGGMMTPISSLQNALAVVYLQKAGFDVSFGQWMLISIPMCSIGVVLCWGFLLLVMKPNDAKAIPMIVYEHRRVSQQHVVVVVSSLTTIGLWALFQFVKPVFGDLGIVALVFMGVMFGTGILTQFDFNSFSWHLLILLGGGGILGKAIQSSGLLETVSREVVSALPNDNIWLVSFYLLLIIVSLTTFVSHTVGAIILTPLVARLAVDMGYPHIPVVLSAFAISAAMALPFSSFPNVNSLLVEDDNGKAYLSVKDFAKVGIPFQFITAALIATVGYGMVIVVLGYEMS